MNQTILGLDPGNHQSGFCLIKDGGIDCEFEVEVVEFGTACNSDILDMIKDGDHRPLVAIETIRPCGIPVAAEVMETLIFQGRIIETCRRVCLEYTYVFRGDIKMFICGRANVKDKNVNQALRDRFGGDSRQKLIKCPKCKGKGWVGRGRPDCHTCSKTGIEQQGGPLYKMTDHAYPALAVALWQNAHLSICHDIKNHNKTKAK